MKVRQLFFVTLMIGSALSKTAHNCAKRIITANSPQAIITAALCAAYSHSTVAGGLEEIS